MKRYCIKRFGDDEYDITEAENGALVLYEDAISKIRELELALKHFKKINKELQYELDRANDDIEYLTTHKFYDIYF